MEWEWRLVMCQARPKAASQAKPSLFGPGQARPLVMALQWLWPSLELLKANAAGSGHGFGCICICESWSYDFDHVVLFIVDELVIHVPSKVFCHTFSLAILWVQMSTLSPFVVAPWFGYQWFLPLPLRLQWLLCVFRCFFFFAQAFLDRFTISNNFKFKFIKAVFFLNALYNLDLCLTSCNYYGWVPSRKFILVSNQKKGGRNKAIME